MAEIFFDPQASPLPEARNLWNQGKRDEALNLFLKANKSQRNNLSASLDAARALGASYHYLKAERLLKTLNSYCRNLPILHLLIGQIYREIRRPSKALEHFNKTLKVLPDSIDALVESAQILERFGNVEKALSRVQLALRLEPSSPLLQVFEARLLSRSDRDEAIAKYRAILANLENVSTGIQSRAMHELAILIEGSHPEEALQLINRAHGLMQLGTIEMKKHGEQSVKNNLAFGREITAEMLSAADSAIPDNERKKIIFLLGFARSGTTLLEKLLAANDSFLDAEELDIYGNYIHPLLIGTLKSYTRDDGESRKVVSFLRDRYLTGMQEHFDEDINEHWLLDKNPSNTIVCASLARTFPEGKFLVMLRDPRDTLLSAYFQYLPPNPESVAFLQWETLVARYVDTMNAWIDLRDKLSADAWCEVRYEKLVVDPAGEIQILKNWLGEENESGSNKSASQYISSPSYADVRAPVHTGRIDRWKQPTYQALFDSKTQEVLVPVMKSLGYEW